MDTTPAFLSMFESSKKENKRSDKLGNPVQYRLAGGASQKIEAREAHAAFL